MIEWTDEGIVLSARRHGETSVIAEVFTRLHGRHAGVVRGGISRRIAPALQPGAQVALHWKARIEDHLGAFTVEALRLRAAALDARVTVAGLSAVTALLLRALPDRDPHPAFHDRTSALLDLTADPTLWPFGYLQWELALLDEMGFGLDLATCAVTGGTDDLCFVSPRSGRAVSRAGAGDWADRLLPLPPVLRGAGTAEGAEIVAALRTTGWFIEHRLLVATGGVEAGQTKAPVLPPARARLLAEIARVS